MLPKTNAMFGPQVLSAALYALLDLSHILQYLLQHDRVLEEVEYEQGLEPT